MHTTPRFSPRCTHCSLGCTQAVPGQSAVPFNKVALIIVSAYPSYLETKVGSPLPPADSNTKGIGAGEFLRMSLRALFDKDPEFPEELKPFENYCFMTNAIKGSPQKGRDKVNITPQMIRSCKEQWLQHELALFKPQTPILISSTEATKSLLGKDESLYSNRRKVFQINQHPAVVTFNFSDVERGAIREIPNAEEVAQDLSKLFATVKTPGKKLSVLVKGKFWKPTPVGSVPWHFSKDLLSIKQLVLDYYNNYYD